MQKKKATILLEGGHRSGRTPVYEAFSHGRSVLGVSSLGFLIFCWGGVAMDLVRLFKMALTIT